MVSSISFREVTKCETVIEKSIFDKYVQMRQFMCKDSHKKEYDAMITSVTSTEKI